MWRIISGSRGNRIEQAEIPIIHRRDPMRRDPFDVCWLVPNTGQPESSPRKSSGGAGRALVHHPPDRTSPVAESSAFD